MVFILYGAGHQLWRKHLTLSDLLAQFPADKREHVRIWGMTAKPGDALFDDSADREVVAVPEEGRTTKLR